MKYAPVVTSFLMADQQILLLKRSGEVGTHRGLWAAVSGYLEGDEPPLKRALTEIQEELGLGEEQVSFVREGEFVRAYDNETETVWVIHPFLFQAKTKAIQLNWENTEWTWTKLEDLSAYPTVPKLREAYDRVRRDPLSISSQHDSTSRAVNELALDRVHGASFLGRRAIELLSATALASNAEDQNELFSELLCVGMRLRKAQSGMANVWNLVGSFLHLVDGERIKTESVSELRELAVKVAKRVVETAKKTSEDAARNSARLLPENGRVLTHSYSTAVFRSLELGLKSGKHFEVYATESYPGMEGKRLAQDLIALGVPVKSIADSAVESIISNVNLVLVGADSVLMDGSLIHKIGTRTIATNAQESKVPFRSVCETLKFSVADFLGETQEVNKNLFDQTPGEFVSEFATEIGSVSPAKVKEEIKRVIGEIYP
ncbi:MAG TPA: NUDIX domain-containing protein [Candidatus Acidoferrales bacterium]|nr:NUDIX domain-containing protein [Candidatus Acidoferrales bacterium]